MKVHDIPPQLSGAAEEFSATGTRSDPFARYVTLSAVVHGAVILSLLGSVWLWGTPAYYKPSSYTVSLVDAPLTLQQSTQDGGAEKPAAQPAPVGDQQPAAPAESAKPPRVEPPPAPLQVTPAEPVKVIPAEPAPKATPPRPKAVAEPQEKKPEPKEPKKPEPIEPKKPALAEPKKPVASPPAATTATEARQAIDKLRERQTQAQPSPPASATATEARQSVDKLRERQTQEAKAQADAAQAQQRSAEEKLAALRARYGTSGTGGSNPGGGGPGGRATGSSGGGPLGDLQRIRLQAYQERVYELIRAAWILPMTQEEARKLQATALLIVSRDGHVSHFQLLKTSGNPMFDESLLRAIKQADPLPPLPDDYQAEALEVELRFKPRES